MGSNTMTAVREKPILFSGPMVRAILDGRKTQTRRVVKPQPPDYIDELHGHDLSGRAPYRLECNETGNVLGYGFQDDNDVFYKCPYGLPGDHLWVREAFRIESFGAGVAQIRYHADNRRGCNGGISDSKLPNRLGTVPSIHMPRHASRITLHITNIRVERLQDISEEDAKAEGVTNSGPYDGRPGHIHRKLFRELWESINGKDSWTANPWVWVVSFERMEKSHDR